MDTASEQTDIVRRRKFMLRGSRDVMQIIELARLERIEGVLKIDLRCGGTPTSAELEERTRVSAVDTG